MGHDRPPRSGKPPDAFDASLDRALASWPAPRAGVDWAAKAADTTARAAAAARPERPSDADLTRPPLPATALEGGRRRVRLWLMAGGLAATTAAAVAAGTMLLATHTPAQPVAPVAAVGPAAVRTGGGAASVHATGWQPAAPAASDAPGVNPSDLPLVTAAAARPAAAPSPSPARAVASARTAAPPAVDPPADPDPALDDSLRPAAGAGSVASPANAPWNVPRRPPVGAIQAGFAAVLPAARACLSPGDPASRAVVTFRSDGTVQDVSLPASAASAERSGCVRAALEKARVPPFAESTFRAPLTVRY
jgi:hypothetical protein